MVIDAAVTLTNIPAAIQRQLDAANAAEARGDVQKAAEIRAELATNTVLVTGAVTKAASSAGLTSVFKQGEAVLTPAEARLAASTGGPKVFNLASVDDLSSLRLKYSVPEGNTLAVARTDIPGLENSVLEGLSPAIRSKAGLPSLDEVYGAKGGTVVEPIVTAKGTVNGTVFEDVNQTAKIGATNEPTLIADRVVAKTEAQGKPFPNGTVADSHAEIGVIQQAYNAGKTQGSGMSMTVSGKDVCGYCKGDIAAAADAAGLKSLTVQAVDNVTGLPKTYYWLPGMKSIKEKP